MTRTISTHPQTTPKPRRTFRPHAEGLEGRQLLSAGDLDLSFAGSGYVLTSPNSSASEQDADGAHAVQILADGSILVAGDNALPADNIALMKFRPDGSLDTTFGTGGRVVTSLSTNNSHANDMVVQPDGKIVVVGYTDNGTAGKGSSTYNWDFLVVRYNPNGSLDTSFGSAGTGKIIQNVSTATSSDSKNLLDWAFAVALQADGKIIVGGYSYGGSSTAMDSSLVRYNSDGTLDATFGQGGKVITAFGPGNDEIRDLSVLPDGKFLARGRVADASGRMTMYVARYLADGTLDASFGAVGAGGVMTLFPSSDISFGTGCNMIVDPSNGSITVAGTYPGAASSDIALARLTAGGLIDTGFGTGGMQVVGTSANEYLYAIAWQPDGRIVGVGYSETGGTKDTLVVRLNKDDGSPDTSFGQGGFITRSFSVYNNFDEFYDVAIQTDGKIVAVGEATVTFTKRVTDHDFLIARFQGDPASLFASAIATTPIPQTLTAAQARPALAQPFEYWQARGADPLRLGHIDLAIADLGGNRLGEASGSNITRDDNAAGWAWFLRHGRKALSGRIDLLPVLTQGGSFGPGDRSTPNPSRPYHG
jgi:uncharacterized delta-60 repeat protein